jgi:uncharacterized protein
VKQAGPDRTLIRAVHWRRLDTPGSEYFALWRTENGWELAGTVVATLDGAPLLARYSVSCRTSWETAEVEVSIESEGAARSLRLNAQDERWRSDREPLPVLEGATDVDLGVTPSTNTLPIRRLGLEVGQEAELAVAWVRFPDLALTRSNQRYTRLGERTYRYTSGSFSRDIEVDDLGVVTSYPGLFELGSSRNAGAT